MLSKPQTLCQQWVLARNYSAYNNKDRPATHYLLSGGKWAIPDEATDAFLAEYDSDVRSGNINHVVELKTEVFPLLLDLDCDAPAEVGDDVWTILYDMIACLLKGVYPDAERRMLVCKAPPKLRVKDGVEVVKTGRHIIVPHILINEELGMRIREALVAAFYEAKIQECCEVLRGVNPYELFDKTVVQSNGLRMLWSYKASPCDLCRKKKRDAARKEKEAWIKERDKFVSLPIEHRTAMEIQGIAPRAEFRASYVVFPDCGKCRGWGYISDPRKPYTPQYWYLGDGTHADVSESRIDVLKLASVRRPGGVVTAANPEFMAETEGLEEVRRVRMRKTGGLQPAGTTSSWREEDDNDIRTAVENELNTKFIPPGGETHTLKSIAQSRTNTKLYRVTTWSRYCTNKGSDHSSPNHVYFFIRPTGIQQRCWSAKAYNGTQCRQWKGAVKPLSEATRTLMFPQNNIDVPSMMNISPPQVRTAKRPRHVIDNSQLLNLLKIFE